MYFLHCSFVAIICSLLNTDLPICCLLIAEFWGNLWELATHQWLVPGVVRRRGQSFSLPVGKIVIPADLCSPRQTYRLQPSHQHTLVLLWTRTAPPLPGWSCTQNHWLMVATCGLLSEEWGQFEIRTFAHTCSEACVFMDEYWMIEIMQNRTQQFVTTI